jgi:predicted transposase YdaD
VEALADDYARLYFDMIVGALTDARRRGLEARMRTRDYEYQTDFARRYVAQGEAKGRAEGEAQGRAEGKAEALLAVLAARGLNPSSQQEHTIRQCADVSMLDRWIVRAVTANSVGDVLD